MAKFEENDVVRFADGNGKMHLWGDNVEIDYMFVQGTETDEDGKEVVVTTSHPYTFRLDPEALVKVGSAYDTRYNEEGDEVHIWLPELDERDDEMTARELAAQYQSSGWSGIGFAQYASTGTVTPELWANIRYAEREAKIGAEGTAEWAADMVTLRRLLAEDGITEPPAE